MINSVIGGKKGIVKSFTIRTDQACRDASLGI
jgi:hypothetical protein